MHKDIRIRGTVKIIVDAVDVEQAEIESPAILADSEPVRAMLAARRKESFKSFQNACERSNHVMEYSSCDGLNFGRYEVLFTIRRKRRDEI